MWVEEFLDDDGGPEVVAIEAGDADASAEVKPQALWVRVGPVYNSNSRVLDEPGVWIEYQERYMSSALAGPVLLTPEVWRQLNKAVEDRIEDFNPTSYQKVEES